MCNLLLIDLILNSPQPKLPLIRVQKIRHQHKIYWRLAFPYKEGLLTAGKSFKYRHWSTALRCCLVN